MEGVSESPPVIGGFWICFDVSEDCVLDSGVIELAGAHILYSIAVVLRYSLKVGNESGSGRFG